mgnify:FL=1
MVGFVGIQPFRIVFGMLGNRPSKVPTGKPPGRPRHKPDDENRKRVLQAAALGITQEGIARLMRISITTLEKHYRSELDRAGDVLVEEIAGAMYVKALNGDIGAQKYILGCRAGWSEKQTIEHTGRIERIERIFIDGPIRAAGALEGEYEVIGAETTDTNASGL